MFPKPIWTISLVLLVSGCHLLESAGDGFRNVTNSLRPSPSIPLAASNEEMEKSIEKVVPLGTPLLQARDLMTANGFKVVALILGSDNCNGNDQMPFLWCAGDYKQLGSVMVRLGYDEAGGIAKISVEGIPDYSRIRYPEAKEKKLAS